MSKWMMMVLTAAMLAALMMAGCGGAGQTALAAAPVTDSALTAPAGAVVPATVNNGRFQAMVRLADLGLQGRSRGGETIYHLEYTLTGPNGASVINRISFINGVAQINETLVVGIWSISIQVVDETNAVVLTGEHQFTISAGQTNMVTLVLHPLTGNVVINAVTYPAGEVWTSESRQLVSHDGDLLSRHGTHRFTWTPAAPAGTEWCILGVDMERREGAPVVGGMFAPVTVTVLNPSERIMVEKYEYTTQTFISARPGTVVEMNISLAPPPFPPYVGEDYGRLVFCRADQPRRVEAILTIVD